MVVGVAGFLIDFDDFGDAGAAGGAGEDFLDAGLGDTFFAGDEVGGAFPGGGTFGADPPGGGGGAALVAPPPGGGGALELLAVGVPFLPGVWGEAGDAPPLGGCCFAGTLGGVAARAGDDTFPPGGGGGAFLTGVGAGGLSVAAGDLAALAGVGGFAGGGADGSSSSAPSFGDDEGGGDMGGSPCCFRSSAISVALVGSGPYFRPRAPITELSFPSNVLYRASAVFTLVGSYLSRIF